MSEQGTALVYVCDRSEIDLGRRELRVRGALVELGSRSFDILEKLVQSGGELVTKDELIGTIWGGAIVEENTLQVHISAIRKALGPDRSLLKTVFGRGYQLLGIWTIRGDREAAPGQDHAAAPPVAAAPGDPGPGRARHVRDDLLRQSASSSHNLPLRITNTLGRDQIIQAISNRFATKWLISVTGSGGIGKTTVAIAVGQRLLDAFEGAVRFVDLGPVGDPSLLADAVASALGLAVRTEDPISGIISFLRDRRMLLILDSCEHVIEAAAALAERIYQEAPLVQVLATSREALRIEGECLQVLPPLDTPPEQSGITATEALTFPAVQLFVERAVAGDSVFALSDADAPLVADICRTLDGMPLAIELAAGRVGAFGVRGMARLIDGQFQLQWQGRRTALPRHRTLAAMLDWSHALLSEPERVVFRRLSVFVGGFVGLKPVLAVCAFGGLNESMVIDAFDGLVAKSLVAADFSRTPIRYRLLDTTRAYAAAKLQESGDASLVGRRHASWFRDFLVRENSGLSEASGSSLCAEHVGNLRAALDWSFGGNGDREIATTLAAAAAPLFLRLSLLAECNRWTERAMIALDASLRGTCLEMELLTWLGESVMFTTGNGERVRTIFERGLSIAETIGDPERQVQLLGWLNVLHLRKGDYRAALAYAQRSEAPAVQSGDPTAIAAARGYLGASCNLLGRNAEAEALLRAAVAPVAAPSGGSQLHFGFNHRNHSLISLARTLWVRGYPDQAVSIALRTVDEAVTNGHPTTLCIALLYAVSVFMWARDYVRAEAHIDPFIECAKRHSLAPYRASGLGVKGEIAIHQGRTEEGIAMLRDALSLLHQDRYEMRTAAFASAMAEGMASLGRCDEALRTIDKAIQQAERDGDLVAMPEMLRIKGDIVRRVPLSGPHDAEAVLLRSLALAESQSARAWALRTATSLARLWWCQGRAHDAERLLASVYERFTEGFGTVDLIVASRLLHGLRQSDTTLPEGDLCGAITGR